MKIYIVHTHVGTEAYTTREAAEKARKHADYCAGCAGSRHLARVEEVELREE
ncbi:hypothetical protein J6Y50_09830 [bacterium]|nr:hypothetical protein [bacterium]